MPKNYVNVKIENKELSIYYYRLAASFLINDEWEEGYNIILPSNDGGYNNSFSPKILAILNL